MKKSLIILFLAMFSFQISANDIKLRTNLLANLFTFYNGGIEFQTSEKYSLEANFWTIGTSTNEDYDGSSLFKFGVMARAYNKKKTAYFGVGLATLGYSAGNVQTSASSLVTYDIKVGQDFYISEDNDISIGYSIGSLGNLPNFGFNLTYKL